MFCTRCGNSLNPNDTVCQRCGQLATPPTSRPGAPPTAHPHMHPHTHPTAPPAAPSPVSFTHNVSYHSTREPGWKESLQAWNKINPAVRYGVIAFIVLSLFGFMGMIASLGKAGSAKIAAQSPTSAVAPPAPPAIPTGPSFSEADSRLDSRKHDLTDAQKTAYWNSISGTMVSWTGEVVSVSSERGGQISLKCNPKTWSSDVRVNLDGTQNNRLHLINKGQQITVKGILRSYGMTGYNIDQGQVQNL